MEKFKIISPVDGSVYAERALASESMIAKTLQSSSEAQMKWQSVSLDERKKICARAVEIMLSQAQEIATELTWQMGRPLRYTPFEILKGFKERAGYMIGIADSALQNREIEDSIAFKRYIKKEALGTVLVLAPWNYPYLTSVNVIIPALLAGNSVILKHAQQTALCAERYKRAFDEAGLAEDVFQFLHINHSQVERIILDPAIDYVAFTGSVSGGHAVHQAVGRRFISAGLELGGKDPAYVMADADLENSIENLVDGSFFNSGQSCCGIERIYVHEKIFDDFIDGFVTLTNQYILGDPRIDTTTLGPMVRPAAARFAQDQIEDARRRGAKTLINPTHFPAHDLSTGYMSPQVLIDVDHSMAVMSEESFGPLVGMMSVKNEKEAIQLMNDSQYGLTASLWTSDVEKAEGLVSSVQAGTVFINRCDYLDPALAWTGVKDSGKGCSLSSLGYDSLTRPKSIHIKR